MTTTDDDSIECEHGSCKEAYCPQCDPPDTIFEMYSFGFIPLDTRDLELLSYLP